MESRNVFARKIVYKNSSRATRRHGWKEVGHKNLSSHFRSYRLMSVIVMFLIFHCSIHDDDQKESI